MKFKYIRVTPDRLHAISSDAYYSELPDTYTTEQRNNLYITNNIFEKPSNKTRETNDITIIIVQKINITDYVQTFFC